MTVTDLSADALSRAIRTREVSCREVMQATLVRIDAVNPAHNAIVSRVDDEVLLRQADERDAQLAAALARSGTGEVGWMHGMPQAIKDMAATAGIRQSRDSASPPWHVVHVTRSGPPFNGPSVARAHGITSVFMNRTIAARSLFSPCG